MERIEELMSFIKRKEEDLMKKTNTLTVVLAILGLLALMAAIAYGVYRFMNPEYIEDLDDDFEDDFDDYFDDDIPVIHHSEVDEAEAEPAEPVEA